MAHQVETMAYSGEVPWHGLGVRVSEAMTSEEAIRQAGLDWIVTQSPVTVGGLDVPGYLANVRSTDGRVLGITSNRYVPVQNAQAFDFTDELIGTGARYEVAMSLRDGKLVVLVVQLDGRKILSDEVKQFLTLAAGHDGKVPIRVFDTSTRSVCDNTYQLALRGAKRVWTFEHSAGVHDRLRRFSETMRNARAYMDGLEAKAEELYRQKLLDAQVSGILDQVFGDEDEFKDQPAKANRIVALKSRLLGVYNDRDDLQNMRGTAWGLYNAFADVAAHGTPTFNVGNVRERRFLSYIDGNKLLKAAQAAIETVAA